MYLSVEGIGKSTNVKKNKKKQKTSILRKNLIIACLATMTKKPSFTHRIECKSFLVLENQL